MLAEEQRRRGCRVRDQDHAPELRLRLVDVPAGRARDHGLREEASPRARAGAARRPPGPERARPRAARTPSRSAGGRRRSDASSASASAAARPTASRVPSRVVALARQQLADGGAVSRCGTLERVLTRRWLAMSARGRRVAPRSSTCSSSCTNCVALTAGCSSARPGRCSHVSQRGHRRGRRRAERRGGQSSSVEPRLRRAARRPQDRQGDQQLERGARARLDDQAAGSRHDVADALFEYGRTHSMRER